MKDESIQAWNQAAALFDRLAPLDSAARSKVLASESVPASAGRWLEELLAAHDSDKTAIIDRQLDQLVDRLMPEEALVLQDAERLIGRQFGPWRATGELGRGGMGIVLSGERADGQFDMQVAIKLLDPAVFGPSLHELFRREIRILAQIRHPGVAQLLDGGLVEDGTPYLVMEYIDGRPLDRYCREECPDLETRLSIFERIAEAVEYCHRQLVVHGDIKPANVLIDRDGLVKLLDFGIASRLVSDEGGAPGRRRPRWCSPGYAAPERMEGAPPAIAEDVFALGAMLFMLLTGTHVRSAPEMTRLLQGEWPRHSPQYASRRARERGVPHSEVKRIRGDLDAIAMRALADAPDDRYPSVRALLEDLRNWRERRPVSVRAASRSYRAACWIRRHSVSAGAALAVVAALLAGSGLALWQADLAREEARRAEQSLVQTEQTLHRVSSLRDFIVDLFATVEPDQPQDELPTTREILRAGAKRVLGDNELSVGERFELAYTLGSIHQSLGLREPAMELLQTAVSLAREHEELQGEELVDALRKLAWAVGGSGDYEGAVDLFDESRLKAREIGDESAEIRAGADGAYVRLVLDEVKSGLSRLRSLRQRLEMMTRPPPDLVYAVTSSLGIGLEMAGELAASVDAKRQAVDAARRAYGAESHRYAMMVANLAGAQGEIGQFSAAREGTAKAIELYGRIFGEDPLESRGAAWTTRARLSARLGQFEQALEEMRKGSGEWAEAMNSEPEEWPQFHLDLAWVLLRAHRWQSAAERLRRAEALFRQQSSDSGTQYARSVVLQGLVLCRSGREEEGSAQLARAGGELLEDGSFQSEYWEIERLEAMAACRLGRQDWASALETIERARAMLRPGWVIESVDLHLMAARARHRIEGVDAAAAELDALRTRLSDLELPADHPAREWINQYENANGLSG